MFIFDWFKSFLGYFGLWAKERTLVIVGLQNSGKTSLVYRLQYDEFKKYPPSLHPSYRSFTFEGLTIKAFVMTGHAHIRHSWKMNASSFDGIVFVVDASEELDLDDAKEELDSLMADERASSKPILILANKIDRPDAISEEEIKQRFNLAGVLTGKGNTEAEVALSGRPTELYMCSMLEGRGYRDGVMWLESQLKDKD